MTFSVDEFVNSVLMKNVPYCRLCLRTGSERRLLSSSSYRDVLLRFPKLRIGQENILEHQLCYVCDAMLRRTLQVLDMVIASQVFTLPIREPLMDKNRLRSLTQTFRTQFITSVDLCQKKSKLCITETLNIDSNEKATIDLTEEHPAPAAAPAPVTAPTFLPTSATTVSSFTPTTGGNIILLPSVGAGNVFQLPGTTFQLPGNTFQLPRNTFQLPANTFQLLNGNLPTGNGKQQWQLVQIVNDLPAIAPPPVPPPPPKPPTPPALPVLVPVATPGEGVNVPVTESGTSGSGSQLFRVEDSDCVAFIETNISEDMRLAGAGASEGLCVVPDSYVYLSDDSDSEAAGAGALQLSGPVTSGPPVLETETGRLLAASTLKRPIVTTRERIVAKDINQLKASPQESILEKTLQSAGAPSLGEFTTSQMQLSLNGLSDANLKAARYRSALRFEDKPMARTPATDASLLAQMRESREPSTRPAVYGQPIRPVPRDREVDWEDRIPVEVITYADEEPAPQSTQLGVISNVYSQARAPSSPAPPVRPAPATRAPAAPGPRKRLKLT